MSKNPFNAKWSTSKCNVCGTRINKGSKVVFDEDNRLVHVKCLNDTSSVVEEAKEEVKEEKTLIKPSEEVAVEEEKEKEKEKEVTLKSSYGILPDSIGQCIGGDGYTLDEDAQLRTLEYIMQQCPDLNLCLDPKGTDLQTILQETGQNFIME